MTWRSLTHQIAARKRSLSYEIDGGHRRLNRKGIRLAKSVYVIYGNNAMSAQLWEVSLLGVGTVLLLERDGQWSND